VTPSLPAVQSPDDATAVRPARMVSLQTPAALIAVRGKRDCVLEKLDVA